MNRYECAICTGFRRFLERLGYDEPLATQQQIRKALRRLNTATKDYPSCISFLIKEYKISEKEVFEKVKTINKRRKKLYDEEYVKEVFERNNLNDDSFLEMIKKRFPSYRDYIKFEK